MKLKTIIFFILLSEFIFCQNSISVKDVNHLIYEKDKAQQNATIEYWTISGKITDGDGNKYFFTSNFYKSGLALVPLSFNYAMIYIIDLKNKKYLPYTYGNPAMIAAATKALTVSLKEKPGDKNLIDALSRIEKKTYNNFSLLPEPYGTASKERPLLLYGPLKFERVNPTKFAYNLNIEFLNYGVNLQLNSNDKPLIYNDENILKVGEKDKADGYLIGYFDIVGKVKKNNSEKKVKGQGFYSHIWGGWNKLSAWNQTNRITIMLENGLKIDYYTSEDRKDRKKLKDQIFLSKGDKFERLEGDFLKAQQEWISKNSGRKYKIKWKIEIPYKGINIEVIPALKEQEVSTVENLGAFWLGSCEVKGTINGKSVKGIALVKTLHQK